MMTLFDDIALALAMGILAMKVMKSCATGVEMRLSRGLMDSIVIALFHAVFVVGGWEIGRLFQLGYAEYDNLFFLGFLVFVAVKAFLSDRKKDEDGNVYDISKIGTVCLLAVATGVNTFLVGLGLGFKAGGSHEVLKMSVPMFVLVLIMTYWGVMLGRQKVEIRGKRWTLVAILLIFVVALRGGFLIK